MLFSRKHTMQILAMSAMSLSFIVSTPSVSLAAGATQSSSKLSAQICPDGNPCPPVPEGSIDCTPKVGKALPLGETLGDFVHMPAMRASGVFRCHSPRLTFWISPGTFIGWKMVVDVDFEDLFQKSIQ